MGTSTNDFRRVSNHVPPVGKVKLDGIDMAGEVSRSERGWKEGYGLRRIICGTMAGGGGESAARLGAGGGFSRCKGSLVEEILHGKLFISCFSFDDVFRLTAIVFLSFVS